MPGWRSHEEIIAWQLATELKNHVYALIEADARIQRDVRFRDHLDGTVSSAPRLIAEGFGRYLPGDFSGYLRKANGELKETLDVCTTASIVAISHATRSSRSSGCASGPQWQRQA
jgi:four helix bundle protein